MKNERELDNQESLNSVSSDFKEFLSFEEAEKIINSGSVLVKQLSANPELAVARVGLNPYGLWGYICKLEGGKYKPFGYTLEPTKNIPEKGYIPAGVYRFKKWDSVKLKKTLRLYSVPNFTDVLVHVGNIKDETRGCILAAYSVDNAKKPTKLVNSRLMTNYLYDNYPSGQIAVGWI